MTKFYPLLFAGLALTTLTGCIDDKYDLSDIDTNIQVNVKDLTLPINLDPITLKSIIDTDGSDITLSSDGTFVIEKTGNITSSAININPISLNAPMMQPSRRTLDCTHVPQALAIVGKAEIPLSCPPTHFDYHVANVSEDVISIQSINTRFSIDIKFSIDDLNGIVKNIKFSNLQLQLPKGLTVDPSTSDGVYNPSTGVLTVSDIISNGTALTIHIAVTAVDKTSGFIFKDNALTFSDDLYIISGTAGITNADLSVPASQFPSSVTFTTDYDLSGIDIISFTGEVQHDIDRFEIPEVNLSSIPKALSQSGTDIHLVNPQIYLSFNNPVSKYGAGLEAGLEIIPYHGDTPGTPITLPAGSISVSPDTEVATFCLSPTKPDSYINDFENAQYIQFKNLGDVVAGDGIPTSLKVSVISPRLPLHKVSDFPIGSDISGVNGRYDFYTALDLSSGSTVHYYELIDGWASEDLDKVTITQLHVTANVTTDTPLDIDLTGHPVDRDGKRIGDVSIKGAQIPANASNYPVDIYITGTVTNLDGIVFDAMVKASSDITLTDKIKISLANIRATVSGHYDDEL